MKPVACSVTRALFCTTNLRVKKMSCSTEALIIWSCFLTSLQAYSSSELLNITTSYCFPKKTDRQRTLEGCRQDSKVELFLKDRRGQDMVIVSSSSLVFGASWKEKAAGLWIKRSERFHMMSGSYYDILLRFMIRVPKRQVWTIPGSFPWFCSQLEWLDVFVATKL